DEAHERQGEVRALGLGDLDDAGGREGRGQDALHDPQEHVHWERELSSGSGRGAGTARRDRGSHAGAGAPARKSFGGLSSDCKTDWRYLSVSEVDSVIRFFLASLAVKMDRSIRLLDWLV